MSVVSQHSRFNAERITSSHNHLLTPTQPSKLSAPAASSPPCTAPATRPPRRTPSPAPAAPAVPVLPASAPATGPPPRTSSPTPAVPVARDLLVSTTPTAGQVMQWITDEFQEPAPVRRRLMADTTPTRLTSPPRNKGLNHDGCPSRWRGQMGSARLALLVHHYAGTPVVRFYHRCPDTSTSMLSWARPVDVSVGEHRTRHISSWPKRAHPLAVGAEKHALHSRE